MNKRAADTNFTLEHLALIDINSTFHPTAAEYTFQQHIEHCPGLITW